jgi:O-antigen/teichoic acid export membrane protein
LLIAVSIAAALLALGFVEAAPLEDWLGFSAINDIEVKIVLLLLVVHVLVGFQGGLLNGGFWVTGSYPSGMALQAITQLLEFGGLAAAVALGGGPVQAASGYLTGRVIGTGLMWIAQRRTSPWLRYGLGKASLSELRELATPAFASLAFPLGNALNIQGMRLIVGLTLGPSAVAVFTPLRTLSRFAMQPRAVINRLIEPELGLAYGSQDSSLFRRLFLRSCQIALWMSLAASFVVGLGARWIFPTWTGGNVTIHWPAYILLLAGVLANSIWYTALMVPYATNRHGRIAVSYALIYGVAPFLLAYLGAKALGLTGVALALLLAETVMAVVVLRVSLRMVSMNISEWGKAVLRPPFGILSQAAADLRRRISGMPQ